jgi:hypothetical protein
MPTAELDYVFSSRMKSTASSLEWVVDVFQWCQWLVALGPKWQSEVPHPRFLVQENTGTFRTCSVVLCIELFLLFRERK